ncbi:MAG: hypothetical protein ACAH89_13580 [Rariglobus sp.]
MQSSLLLAMLLPLFTGCIVQEPRRYPEPRTVVVQPAIVIVDDYDYYPSYGVYYSRNRREYVYLDGGRWVRSPEPRGVTVQVLLSTPTVRMGFRDAPEHHHSAVVQSYPKNWGREENSRNDDDHGKGRKDKKPKGNHSD